jgi:preprotein translocase subunit SecF
MPIQLIKDSVNIDFVGYRKIAYTLTSLLIIIGFLAIIMNKGLNYGVDFAGGVMVQIEFKNEVSDEEVKGALKDIEMPGLIVQKIGEDNHHYLLRFSASESGHKNLRQDLNKALQESFQGNEVEITRLEMVGPKVGSELRDMAVEAVFYSILLITVYISGRFEHNWFTAAGIAVLLWGIIFILDFLSSQFGIVLFNKIYAICFALVVTLILAWKVKLNYSLGTLLSLIHDVFITLGLLTLFGKEIDLNVIAALLTLVGYSLNDTIVIYDRIRENIAKVAKQSVKPTIGEVINMSANQTLSRTLMTSFTTLAACLSLYILGGSVINDFALTMLIGIIVGSYSSIFVASPILMAFGDIDLYINQQKKEEDFEKPGAHGVV